MVLPPLVRRVGARVRRWPWRVLLLACVGAAIGLALGGRSQATIGPFESTIVARPSWSGQTTIELPPLGSIRLDTHTGPIALQLRVDELRPEDAARIADDPTVLDTLEDELSDDAIRALRALAVRAMLATVLGGAIGAVVGRTSWRALAQGTAVGGLAVAVLLGGVAATFRAEAISEPRYTGLLTVAPQAVGDVQAIVERFDDYRAQLADLVVNLVTIYRAADALPALDPGDDAIRVLHVSDMHNNPQGFDLALRLSRQFEVDVVLDTGDITDWGSEPESLLLDRVASFDVPYLYVRGNHDSRGTQDALAERGAVVLDDTSVEVAGLRFWGIGDPRYTPDRSEDEDQDAQAERIERFADTVRRSVRRASPSTIDVLAVHDPRSAAEVGDLVPLVLAGHTHRASEQTVGDALVLVEGSTGGAGLRGLQDEEPRPLAASILYFDPDTRRLVAYDRISVQAFGGSAARIERHVVAPEATEELDPDDE